MKYFRTNRGWKVLFIGATAPWGRLIGQVGRGVITPGESQPGHLETDFDQLFFGAAICDKFQFFISGNLYTYFSQGPALRSKL